MKSVFPRACPAIEKVYEAAGSPRKVMLVPIDYAKREHTALVCDGEGRSWRAAFPVHNSPAGVAFLLDVVAGLCRKHHVKREHVLFAGEDCGSFCFNFIHALLARGNLVFGVNGQDAKTERSRLPASTDKIDLTGIAAVLRRREGRPIALEASPAAVVRHLTRYRNGVVSAHTASANRLHHLSDQLLPGFLDEKKSGVCPFTRASLWLMQDRFSPAGIRARRLDALVARFEEFGLRKPAEAAVRLKALADDCLPPPPALLESLQYALTRETEIFARLDQTLQQLRHDLAMHIAATPGAMLTTMPGVSIVLAAGLYAELGDPQRRRGVRRLCAYGGLAPRLKQTGGSGREAVAHGPFRRCNQPLANLLFQLSALVRQHGCEDMRLDAARREQAGQDVDRAFGRRQLRTVLHLLDHQAFFLPPELRARANRDELRAYYAAYWPRLLVKWRDAGAIQQALAKDAPLENWRLMLNELYDLNLSKISPQADALRGT